MTSTYLLNHVWSNFQLKIASLQSHLEQAYSLRPPCLCTLLWNLLFHRLFIGPTSLTLPCEFILLSYWNCYFFVILYSVTLYFFANSVNISFAVLSFSKFYGTISKSTMPACWWHHLGVNSHDEWVWWCTWKYNIEALCYSKICFRGD